MKPCATAALPTQLSASGTGARSARTMTYAPSATARRSTRRRATRSSAWARLVALMSRCRCAHHPQTHQLPPYQRMPLRTAAALQCRLAWQPRQPRPTEPTLSSALERPPASAPCRGELCSAAAPPALADHLRRTQWLLQRLTGREDTPHVQGLTRKAAQDSHLACLWMYGRQADRLAKARFWHA